MTAIAMITPYQRNVKGPSFPMIGLMLMVMPVDLLLLRGADAEDQQSGPAYGPTQISIFLLFRAQKDTPTDSGAFLLAQGQCGRPIFAFGAGS